MIIFLTQFACQTSSTSTTIEMEAPVIEEEVEPKGAPHLLPVIDVAEFTNGSNSPRQDSGPSRGQ